MRLRPLIVGTFLAICFWGISLVLNGAGNAQRPNQAAQNELDDGQNRDLRMDLLVTFEGTISQKGQLVIQLYRDADSFEKRRQPFDQCYLKLEISDEVLWQFRGLPKGEYAIVAFHDANENWKMDVADRNSTGEKVCFSQVVKAGQSFPSFEQCKFPVTRNRMVKLKWD